MAEESAAAFALLGRNNNNVDRSDACDTVFDINAMPTIKISN